MLGNTPLPSIFGDKHAVNGNSSFGVGGMAQWLWPAGVLAVDPGSVLFPTTGFIHILSVECESCLKASEAKLPLKR